MGTIVRQCTRGKPRAAIFFDLENLIYRERLAQDWVSAVALIEQALRQLEERALPVVRVAICDPGLARQLAIPLADLGIRTFTHRDGVDGADRILLERVAHDVPPGCGLIVIASGDHIFAPAARALRLAGKRVEVISRPGLISAELYRAANTYIDLTSVDTKPAA